jgi:hypothetical protein
MTRLRSLLLCAVTFAAAGVRAAPPPEAVKLFTQCVADFEAGRVEAARACFLKVYAIYKSPVVLFNLGRTEESLGNLVEAYEAYQSALADTTGTLSAEERTDVQQRTTALAGRIALLKLPALPPGATVQVDGQLRPHSAADGIPVLPGDHEVRVEAPGMRPWVEKVTALAGGSHELGVNLEAPRPTPAPPPPRPTPPPPAPTPVAPMPQIDESAGSGLRTFGLVLGSAGLASLVTGTVLGVMAKGKNNDALTHCSPYDSTLCDPEGVTLTNQAWNLALGSTIALAAGGAALATGVVLYFVGRAQRRSAYALRVTPLLGPGTAALALQGGF